MMILDLRYLEERDYPLTMAWRSNPLVYQGFYQQSESLEWEDHIKWINSRNRDWRNFIVMYEERPVGVVTIGQLDHWCPEIGYYIGETTLWGKGIGKEAVRLGLEYIKNYGREYCHTTVLKSNTRSLKVMKRLGFEKCGRGRENEIRLQKKL